MLKAAEQGLLSADLAGGLNLFTGAGFSTLAKNSFQETLPVGDGLKALLLRKFELDHYAGLDLASLYAVLVADRREALREYLESVFKIDGYDGKYDVLRLLNVQFFYTTNVDDLPFYIFNARAGDDARILHDVTTYGAP